jgi:hypothetical protein
MKIFIPLGVAVAVLAVGGSLIHPFGSVRNRTNDAAIFGGAQLDPNTRALFERACLNCHSERTMWPWYSQVAPMSWMIERDVHQARSHMNLSRWPEYAPVDRLQLLSKIGSVVRNQHMPPERYLLLHPEARLTNPERQEIYEWTRAERSRGRAPAPQPLVHFQRTTYGLSGGSILGGYGEIVIALLGARGYRNFQR